MIFIEGCSRSEGKTAESSALPTRSEERKSGQPRRNRESPAKSAGDHQCSGCRANNEAGGIVGIRRQVGVVRAGVGEMAERREDEFAVNAADGAKHVARL